ncbi:flagellin N-terminal helical domain-containing protein [Thiomicrorhabdus chilensis]|uniref:flagellin N-terminal helical domain-containing protein n=1 Tax=Thiomicrorhabdus chilensis TaxID=63656 RepID=UPI000402D61B|nr:flagellin [Thiomicrorhabdus chilensis]
MAMVINTNMGSLNAVRLLEGSSKEQQTSMERLTSGLRINKAADDAAGLAVVTQMSTQIRGTDMAIRNANDGIAKVQTLDGASEEVTSMMQRMRELGVQALNGTYSQANRSQMDEEFTQLKAEIERIAQTTKFNGVNMMNGAASDASNAALFHVGWETGANNKISMSVLNFSAGAFSDGAGFVVSDLTLTSTATGTTAASATVVALDGMLSRINTQRASWGALQNRLESTVSNLTNVNENIQSSRSRIQDADFAKESANLARTQVLQQAGMSMLSQSNQQSQNVLQLLQ